MLRGAERTLARSWPAILVEIEQRHREDDVRDTFRYLEGIGYRGCALYVDGLRALGEFDLERDQLRFLGPEYIAGDRPQGYINDYLFVVPQDYNEDTLRRFQAPRRSRSGGAAR